jgi:hypothetical protein
MVDSTVYEFFSADSPHDKAMAYFGRKYGYQPERLFEHHNWLFAGPVYRTKAIEREALREGAIILLSGQWQTIGLIDGASMLTDSGEYLDLPELVTVRG